MPLVQMQVTKSLKARHWQCTYFSRQAKSMISSHVQFGIFSPVAVPVRVVHSLPHPIRPLSTIVCHAVNTVE